MNLPLIGMTIVFVFFMFFGMPLSFSMIFGCLVYLLMAGKDLYILVHQMFTGIDTFTLMAIPFFMLAGELMVYSGTAEKLLDFANLLVGRFRGGLAYVNVLASMLFGGCSGSALSDVAGLGKLEIEMMEKAGYSKEFSAALTVTSSIQGPLIPPSIPMVLIGSVTGTSIGGLLLGGAIPGILVGVCQALIVFFIARKRDFGRFEQRLSFSDKMRIVVGSIPFLFMPIIILGGILGGIFTPTEASAVAVAYGLILTLAYRSRELDWKALARVFMRAGTTAGALLMLSAASNIFSWVLSAEKVPDMLVNLLLSISDNPYVILFIVNILLLVWGMFMDMLPAIVILAPVLFPLAQKLGIHPIHFGVVMGYNLIVGLITPPYGSALFTGAIVSGLPMEKIVKEAVPFIIGSIAILFLITYFPQSVMFLPTLFGLDR